MKHSNVITIVLCLGLLLVPACVAQDPEYRRYQIHEINQALPKENIFFVQGFIAKIYKCPACPKGVLCKPCMKPNVVISEQKIELATYSLTSDELVIFVKEGDDFKLGEKYTFLVKRSGRVTTASGQEDLEAVSFTK